MKFECHITCYVSAALPATRVASEEGWKTSQIARDPTLGDDTYFYLTCHASDYTFIARKMRATVLALRKAGVHVVREKIEETVHDKVYGTQES